MKNHVNFNDLMDDLKAGRISTEKVVEKIAVFIQTEYRMFNLDNYDEDIRSNIVYKFLQTGSGIIERYNPDSGSFFNYIYSCLKGIGRTEFRSQMVQNINNRVSFLNSLDNLPQEEEKYNFVLISEKKLISPFDHLKPEGKILFNSVKDFMHKTSYSNNSKAIVVLAMKACYDISDDDIRKICEMNKIDEEDFFNNIQILRRTLEPKVARRNKYLNKRNFAYYNHRKYNTDDELYKTACNFLKSEYKQRYEKSTLRWLKTNEIIEKGFCRLCPTNKAIADLLSISERQVCYYIRKLKDEYGVLDQSEKTEKDKEN